MATEEYVLNILDLPTEIIENILSFISCDEIAKLRVICREFDHICQSSLNKEFMQVDRYHAQCLRNVKGQLPRRESERRNHPLARHCDILTAIETRLSLLGMTFMKYIEMNMCCFIPGKVIDEIYRVLRYIQQTKTPPRAHEILQELRDISSMAMEHFDEKIVPTLKQKIGITSPRMTLPTTGGTFSLPGTSSMLLSHARQLQVPIPPTRSLQQEMLKLQQTIKQTNAGYIGMKKELRAYKMKMLEQQKKLREQENHVLEQNRLLAEQNNKLVDQDGKINEVNRKLLEYDQKFADLMAELSRSRDDSQGHDLPVGLRDHIGGKGLVASFPPSSTTNWSNHDSHNIAQTVRLNIKGTVNSTKDESAGSIAFNPEIPGIDIIGQKCPVKKRKIEDTTDKCVNKSLKKKPRIEDNVG